MAAAVVLGSAGLVLAATTIHLAGTWEPHNRTEVETWLNAVAARPTTPAKIAVFDWDDTSMARDIGVATFRYQLDHLVLRRSPSELAAMLPTRIGDVTQSREGVAFADLKADIEESYAALWPHISRGDIKAARALPAAADFKAKAAALYVQLEEVDTDFAYRWLVRWYAGMRPSDVEAMAAKAYDMAAKEGFGSGRWTSSSPGRAGAQSFAFETGAATQTEIKSLMAALHKAGVEPYVVSASLQDVVRGVARHLGYPVKPEHIFGVRLRVRDGVLTDALVDEPGGPVESYPLPYGKGKVAVIDGYLPARPLFVAGDSVAGDAGGDYAMLTLPEVELRLVLNRRKKAASIYDTARNRVVERTPAGQPVITLLQGRDENTGRFVPSQETVPLMGR